ncbi:MAG: two-component sensor histidine kinase [Subtercola sp.]|nr:two-component sensor histidine kinase [Subtercola sp.]
MNPQPGSGWLSVAHNLFGVIVVTWAFATTSFSNPLSTELYTVAGVGLFAWLVVIVLPLTMRRVSGSSISVPTGLLVERIVLVVLAVMAFCGAIAAVPTLGIGIALTVAAVIRTVGNSAWPLWCGGVLVLVSAAIVAAGALVQPASPDGEDMLSPIGLLAIEGGIVIAAMAGLSRRQYRHAEAQADALREERLVAREKQATVAALSERQAIAREIHDVLAHSLGGLVIQLDAVDALLESGDLPAAEIRVRDARQLAASGLAEARRAVDALREPDAASTFLAAELLASLTELVDANRALGTTTWYSAALAPDVEVTSEAALALRRTLQEALTNARKHAAAEPVEVTVGVTGGVDEATVGATVGALVEATRAQPVSVHLRVVNPLGTPLGELGASGNQHGLAGMTERFSRLPGARVSAGVIDGRFVVDAVVRRKTGSTS